MAYNTKYYDDAIESYKKQANENLKTQIAKVDADTSSQLRQAYLNRLQNQKTLSDRLATAGIRGGMTETANLNLMNNEATTRNNINSTAAQSKADLVNTTNQNISDYTRETNAARQEYIQNREAEDRERANQLADEERQRKQQLQTQAWTAKYSKYYTEKNLNKAYKAAKTQEERAIINARIAYLRKHKKKY